MDVNKINIHTCILHSRWPLPQSVPPPPHLNITKIDHETYMESLLHSGESKTLQRGKVSASVWMDNKLVTVMSTNTQPSATGSVLRRQRDGSRTSVPCPKAVISYNSNMGGVDRGDQWRGYYNCRTKSRKFYKYIFYFLLDVSINNAFILWKNFGSATGMTLKEFRLRLAEQLIGAVVGELVVVVVLFDLSP